MDITAFENSSITTQTYSNFSLCIYVNGSQLRREHHAFGTLGLVITNGYNSKYNSNGSHIFEKLQKVQAED